MLVFEPKIFGAKIGLFLVQNKAKEIGQILENNEKDKIR